MPDKETITGIILRAEPVGERDRRATILTGEKGKISVFFNGARNPRSPMLAASNPFCFGAFDILDIRGSYRIAEARIENYFPELRDDCEAAFYGMYFLELMDYYTRENNDERNMLNLLYLAIKALSHPKLDRRLTRIAFEIKALVFNGEYPGPPDDKPWRETTIYTLKHIEDSGIEKLFNFSVSEEVCAELMAVADIFRRRFIDKPLKGLDML